MYHRNLADLNARHMRANGSIERAPPSEASAGLPDFLRQYIPLLDSYESELVTLEPPSEQSTDHRQLVQAVSDLADVYRDMERSLEAGDTPEVILPKLESAMRLQRSIVDQCKVLESEADPATNLSCTELFEASFVGLN